MVFPSLPIYLDPPNWSQQQPSQQAGIGIENPHIPPPHLQPPPSTVAAVGGGGCYQASSIRPGSMADRARLAKIHQPDMTLKCPRCESTNTKFCYYNNYSLSQPRHFCKTCRRYWTRGGALRNVPVGGGCRRNKRSKGTTSNTNKSSISKSPNMKPGSSSQSANSNSSSGCTNNNNNNNINDVMGHNLQTPPPPTQLPLFFPNNTLHHHYSTNGGDFVFGANPSSLVARNGNTTSDHEFQWRLPNLQQVQQNQHFPNFLMTTNLEPQQVGFFHQFEEENNNGGIRFRSSNNNSNNNNNNKGMDDCGVGGIIPNEVINNVKMEGNHQGLSLSKNVGNDVFWSLGSGNAWSAEVPSFTNSSTSHLL